MPDKETSVAVKVNKPNLGTMTALPDMSCFAMYEPRARQIERVSWCSNGSLRPPMNFSNLTVSSYALRFLAVSYFLFLYN